MAHEDTCPHCRAKRDPGTVAEVEAPVVPDLPAVPTPIRVHTANRSPFDCTLHPDGMLTAVIGGEVCRNFMSFADMCERSWTGAHFEMNPEPMQEPSPAAKPIEVVQESLAL